LLGASGQIGLFALARLVGAGFRVLAVSRHARPEWYPEFSAVEWLQPDELGTEPAIPYLLSAGPVGLAAEQVPLCRGLERAVVFSTSSVYTKTDSADRQEQHQMQSILHQEASLKAACDASHSVLALYRPTLIYGCGMDANVTWLYEWIRRFGRIPVAGAASGLRQPVHADDLAHTAVNTLLRDQALSLDEPLCGGESLSFREMVKRVFVSLDRPQRILTVPTGLLAAVVSVARLLPSLRALRPEMVRRQNRDLVFDDSAARLQAGHAPREFTPSVADFQRPETKQLLRLASSR
jgi:nucleoside-diphosphate-sugar epimerase